MPIALEVHGRDIVIAAAATDYVVTHHKPEHSPQLIAKKLFEERG